MTEAIRTHPGRSCIALGLVLIVIGALLSPGGDMQGAILNQTAAVVLTVGIYVVLRRSVGRST
jgi:hypothetical protein